MPARTTPERVDAHRRARYRIAATQGDRLLRLDAGGSGVAAWRAVFVTAYQRRS
ncbi:hypothetical protein [Burkholderia aenigmatica]|uniref:hypothetical protein n=1 Tax=Burkholderia aenigmatica TaxID=2015348 RepID=UPI0015C62963|nr:hypothetical protein [Burkholderia aenigmatica]